MVVCVLLLIKSYQIGSWRNNRSIIHDITSYYCYLPAAFIYDDFTFNYRYQLPENEPLDHVWVNVKGDTVFQKMSVGMSYFYAPSFLIAHWYTKYFTNYNANGFSKPYQMAMNMNTLFFGLLSVFLTALLALRFFEDHVAAAVTLLMFAATNLLYYISGAPGMTHPYSYFLLVLLYLFTLEYFRSKKPWQFMFLAFCIGLMALVRPTNLILALFPLLYGLNPENRKTLMSAFRQPFNYILFAFFFLIPWVPQFIYWDYATGDWLFYSYDEERFFFNKPHVFDGLFSYRKGWFVYTPVMAVAALGLLFTKKYRAHRWPLLVIFPLFAFVVFSWWCWWYGGSLGSRAMIEFYPFMLLGLGVVVQFTIDVKWYAKIPLVAVLLFTMVLNFNQTTQYSIGMLHWDSMSKASYWSIFLKDTPPDNFNELLEAPDYKKAIKEGE